MKLSILTCGLVVALTAAARGQAEWQEARFHRVHLRNGNFIDGQLIKQTPKEAVLQLKVGTITVRLDQVARDENGDYKIVFVKVRSLNEAPKPVPREAKSGEKEPKATPKSETPKPPTPDKPREPLVPTGTTAEKVSQIIAEIGLVPAEKKFEVGQLFQNAGEGWELLALGKLESLDDASGAVVGSILAASRKKEVQGAAVPLLLSEKASVRTAAIKILAESPENAYVGQIRRLLSDPDTIVRGAALNVVRKASDAESFDAVARLCMDSDAVLRKQALDTAQALAQQHGLKKKLNEVFADSLRSANPEQRVGLIQAIAKTEDREAWEVIAPFMNDEAPTSRYEAAMAVSLIRTPAGEEALLARFGQEKEKSVQVAIINSCRIMKLEKAVEPIIEWMRTDDRDIKALGGRALREITGQKFGTDAEAWAQWWAAFKGNK